MSPSPYIRGSVRRLAPYIPGEQPRDSGIIKLNTNENPYPPSPQVGEALVAYASGDLRRYPDPVCRELRELLAEEHGCRPDQIIMGNGSDELLALCTRALVEPEGKVGFFEPSYSLYPVLSEIQDLATRPIPLTDDFSWPEGVADCDAQLFLLTHPNAPTGMVYPDATLRAFCEAFEGVVVIDEAYADFAEAHYMDLALTSDRVIVLRTLSKSYSLAGIRLGYAVGPAVLIDALYRVKDSYNLNALTQAVGLAALRDRAWMERNTAKVCATRERVRAALVDGEWEVLPSQSNFLFIAPAVGEAEEVFDGLRAQGILTRYFPGAKTDRYLRVTIGTDNEMDTFLKVLREGEWLS